MNKVIYTLVPTDQLLISPYLFFYTSIGFNKKVLGVESTAIFISHPKSPIV